MAEINTNIAAPPTNTVANSAMSTANTTIPATPATPATPASTTTPLPFLTRKAQAGVSIMELSTAVPLLFSSLVSQAETIVGEERDHPSSLLINFMTTSFKSLSGIFSWGFHRIVPKSNDPNDVTINQRPFAFDNILTRVSQPVFVKEATSFIFAMRRALFSFIPNVFTVPAEDHDPTKPVGKIASGFMTDMFRASSSFLSPFRVVSSLITSVFALSSHGLGALFAYSGDQKPFNFTKFTSRISDCLLPVTTNLNSLYKVTRAYKDSWSSSTMHLGRAFDRYNINFAHVIQGVLGSIVSIPYFCGALLKIRNIVLEKDHKDPKESFALANLARDLIGALSFETVALTGLNAASMQASAHRLVTRLLEYVDDYSSKSITRLMNFNPKFKSFFSTFRPIDSTGTVLPGEASELVESSSLKENYVFNRFKKSEFFSEMFDWLHPIQSALMLLPNAFVGISDVYVQDNGTKYLRWLDRLVGVNSMILSLPNYFIYLFKTRAPQLVLKYYETKQRKADLEGRSCDAYLDFNKFIQTISKISLPGCGYVSRILEMMDVQPGDFHDATSLKLKYNKLEEQAAIHEPSVKASELVAAMRIGMRHIISTGSPMFFAQRDPVTGFTAEEQSKDDAYKSIGKFSQLMRGIPFVGWGLAYFVDMFRSMYKVAPTEGRKRLQIQNKAMA